MLLTTIILVIVQLYTNHIILMFMSVYFFFLLLLLLITVLDVVMKCPIDLIDMMIPIYQLMEVIDNHLLSPSEPFVLTNVDYVPSMEVALYMLRTNKI